MSAVGSLQDSQLGLTQSELMILRQSQEVNAQTQTRGSAMADRGRGTSRHSSQPSSRAASAGSSRSGPGSARTIPMDSSSFSRMETALNDIVRTMKARIDQLEEALEQSIERQRRATTDQATEMETRRTRQLGQEFNNLEQKMADAKSACRKIKRIREAVDAAGGRLDQRMLARAGGQLVRAN